MLDRNKAPEIHEIEAVTLQIAEVTHLSNGAKLHYIKSETQPVIRLDFVFKAGKWYEPQAGISDLTGKMLFEGTLNYSAKQIAEIVAFYGASFENNQGYDRSEFTLYCLSKYVPELLPLVLDVIQNPTFPDEEFNLLKKRNQQNLKVQRQKNSYLATHSFTKLVYGANHPYIFGLDENGLDGVTKEELVNFYKARFSTKNLDVFACGSIDDSLQQLLEREIEILTLAGDTNEGHKKLLLGKESYDFVDMPDSLQSSIRVGKQFPTIHHADYHKLVVLNEILGGYFGSRLMRNIREDKGYTYGIFSAISPKEHDSLFYIGTDVNYEVTNNTIDEIKKEIKILQTEEVPDDELNVVKNYMLGKFLNDIATIFEQCDRYKRIVLQDLPMEHYNNYITAIRGVTSKEIKELAQQYLNIEELKIAVAGKKSK
ncbi:insulinase family protein [Pontibacter sp. JH31]|uniref:Insulinase family protein n=1 Tax=Pontibacter aquaedesilientis TaxID=2766980 RepID=A0ABR7XGI6_9BACT|nr:pitrilysin family protein [Pontibacter aquaedesilientis]MBD1396521.1 insulinase family protein [Pontibacter aquaedesilientis]